MNIRVTAKVPALHPSAPLIRARPKAEPAHDGPALSRLSQDETSTHPLTAGEVRHEIRVAYAIIQEMLARVGINAKMVNIPVTMHRRFVQRMGDAREFAWRRGERSPNHILGRIRLSSSALWRRATPEKRRNTVIHELAHVLANSYAGRNAGHGEEWKTWMRKLGEEPIRCHDVNRHGLTKRGVRVVNADAKVTDFAVGDRVTFYAKRRTITGEVIKLGRKKLKIREDQRGIWTCGPAILRKIT